MVKHFVVIMSFLIIGSFISGCEQGELSTRIFTPSTLSTLSPSSTSSVTLMTSPSLPPSPMKTPFSASTPIVTATRFRLSIPVPLSSAVLTQSEVIDQYPILEGYFGAVMDVTGELIAGNHCLLECVKQVWSGGRYGARHLVITMIKSSSPQKAQKLVEDTRKTFVDIDDLSDRSALADLPKDTWSVYYYPRHEFVLNYSYGQVFVLMVSQPNSGFDDFAGEFDLITLLSRLQMEKLYTSGYTP